MKTQEHLVDELRQSRCEADVEASIDALFLRCPTLCGFSVRGAASLAQEGFAFGHLSRFFVTDVSVFPFSPEPRGMSNEIVGALCELVEQCPEAADLLRERTFARAFH